jgi:hypothetical protein
MVRLTAMVLGSELCSANIGTLSGALAGAGLIDRALEILLMEKIGFIEWAGLQVSEVRDYLKQGWHNGIKTRFAPNRNPTWPLRLGPKLHHLTKYVLLPCPIEANIMFT